MAGFSGSPDETEISELYPVIRVNQDVVGFDVAVNHPFGVRHRQSRQHSPHDGGGCVRGHRTSFVQQFAQRATGDQLHDEVDRFALR